MKKLCLTLLVLSFVASNVWASKVNINGTAEGQFHTINILGAENSTVDGGILQLDTREVAQSSSTAGIAALTIDQDDEDQPTIKFECTSESGNTKTCAAYSTTNATKSGAVRVNINGTDRWINFYDQPN